MQIHRFYTPQVPECGKRVALPPDEARHAARVLRLAPGDSLVLLDGRGTRAEAVLAEFGKGRRREVVCQVVSRRCLDPPARKVILYVAAPRGKRMARVLRAATELGVWIIRPILCHHGICRPPTDVRKRQWASEIIGAVKQSGNVFAPELGPVETFDAALGRAPRRGYFGSLPDPAGEHSPGLRCVEEGDLAVWIGPEGGFSESEEESLVGRGYVPLALGQWILRVETAVPAVLGWLCGVSGDD